MYVLYFLIGIRRGEIKDLVFLYDVGRMFGWGKDVFLYWRELLRVVFDIL